VAGGELINRTMARLLERDPGAFIIGCGCTDNEGVYGTCLAAKERFPDRVFDCPLSEKAVMGLACGAAAEGMLPVVVHARADFLLLTMDPLCNHAAKWEGIFGVKMPLIVRAVIGYGWGQAGQHSQVPVGALCSFPGIRFSMPVRAEQYEDLFRERPDGPLVIFEHRMIHRQGDMPKALPRFGEWTQVVDDWREDDKARLLILTLGPTYRWWSKGLHLLRDRGFGHRILATDVADPLLGIPHDLEYHATLIVDPGHALYGWADRMLAEMRLCQVFGDAVGLVAQKQQPAPASPRLDFQHHPNPKNVLRAACHLMRIETPSYDCPEVLAAD